MTEQVGNDSDSERILDPSILAQVYRERVNNHFFSGTAPLVNGRQPIKEDYTVRTGLVLTNNLRKYVTDDPYAAVTEGRINDPMRRRMGRVMRQLKEDEPELWQRAQEAVITGQEATGIQEAYLDKMLMRGASDPVARLAEYDSDYFEREAVLSELFDALAPRLHAKNIDPLLACI